MNKKITLLLFAIVLMAVAPVQAQVKLGVKGGLNINNMSLNSDLVSSSNRTGFFIGPTLKFTLPVVGLGIDAAALYDQREAKSDDKTIKSQSLNIPINLRYIIGLGNIAGIYFAAGPQFGFNVGNKNIYTENDLNATKTTWNFKDSNFSINLGTGVMLLKHLEIGANYNIVCGKTGDVTVKKATDSVTSTSKNRSNAWQISAAYYF
ncbi:porin family protein [Xylanibacter oryzae]|uniref:porin family protein n=1 Tax=Xylanibacter oryzae TaxID=185293 RepID=UPI000566BABC|nr:porin family protein [Xylanibacter oryzae]